MLAQRASVHRRLVLESIAVSILFVKCYARSRASGDHVSSGKSCVEYLKVSNTKRETETEHSARCRVPARANKDIGV